MQREGNIVRFNNWPEFESFLAQKKLTKKLGEGGEGSCFLSKKDNHVYKKMDRSLFEYTGSQHNLDEIITTEDIKLKYFMLPEELYAIRKRLVGYKTKYVDVDLFEYPNLKRTYNNIYQIDFETLKKAYKEMLREVEFLSQNYIMIYDLSCNLMFTGDKFIAIDTCFYQRVSKNPYEYNVRSLDNAIKLILEDWLKYNPEITEEQVSSLLFEKDIYEYVDDVSKVISKTKKRTRRICNI